MTPRVVQEGFRKYIIADVHVVHTLCIYLYRLSQTGSPSGSGCGITDSIFASFDLMQNNQLELICYILIFIYMLFLNCVPLLGSWSLQVWRSVSRFIQTSQLPSCNANIQREQAEIWVFCDVLHSEQVGHFLKDKLQLYGKICLTVHRRGSILSI